MAVKLHVDDISLSFGGIKALQNVDFEVQAGQIFAVIGPNGAGKTSLINSINGFYTPQAGSIRFEGADITHMPPYKRAALGISRTFQNIALYTNATVLDNMPRRAPHPHAQLHAGWRGFLGAGAARRNRPPPARRRNHRLPGARAYPQVPSWERSAMGCANASSSGGHWRWEPSLLLLDEPMAGMNVEEKEDMARYILDIHERQGATIMLIEHDIGLVMDISQRIAVINFGVKIGEGAPDEISQNQAVIDAYLGEAEH